MVRHTAKKFEDPRKEVARLMGELAPHEYVNETAIPGVKVVRHSEPTPPVPGVYKPCIVIVGQGSKCSYLAGKRYANDTFNYLVFSVPMPVECETRCTPDEPLLMTIIEVEPSMVGEMLLELDEPDTTAEMLPQGIISTPLDDEISGALIRLLKCLRSTRDSRMLGRQIVREIVYRVLSGEQGGSLRALAGRNEQFNQIARLLRSIHADPAQPLTIEGLAKKAGMSVSAFHQNFKQVTGSSPLQYVKRMRLDRAKRLMSHDGYNASTAAREVGYESVSQFGREFKRLFGAPPLEETGKTLLRLNGENPRRGLA